jgi:hypothetical protein
MDLTRKKYHQTIATTRLIIPDQHQHLSLAAKLSFPTA